MSRRALVALFALSAPLALAPSIAAGQQQNRPVGQTASSASQPVTVTDADVQMLRADIRAKRKQVTAENMSLTPDEATKFWPLYDQYIKETIRINDVRWTMMKDYAASYKTMTDAQAADHAKRSIAVDKEFIALRESYLPKFEQLVGSKKAVQWYQIDRRLELLIGIQLASLIPMVENHQ